MASGSGEKKGPSSSKSDDNVDPFSKPMKIGAFVDPGRHDRTLPVPKEYPLLKLGRVKTTRKTPPTPPPPPPPPPVRADRDNGNVVTLSSLLSRSSRNSTTSREDFILLQPVKAPFASPTPISELGRFYTECHRAPELEGCSSKSTVAERVGDLTQQLEQFEVNLKEYDNVITEFCSTDNNN